MKQSTISDMHTELSSLYNSKLKSPTALMELSEIEYKRIKYNSIHIGGISVVKGSDNGPDTTMYSDISYGSRINSTNWKVNIGEYKWYEYIHLNKTKNRYVMITADKGECLAAIPNTFCYCTNMTAKKKS